MSVGEFAWLVTSLEFPTRDEATGVLSEIYRLGDLLSPVGTLIVLSTFIYFIGAAVERPTIALAETCARASFSVGEKLARNGPPWALPEGARRPERFRRSFAWNLSGLLLSFAGNESSTTSQRGGLLIDDLVSEALEASSLPLVGMSPGDVRDAGRGAFFSTRDPTLILADLAGDEAESAHQSAALRLREEIDSLRIELLRKAPSLHAQSDRLRAEGELRIVAALPLAALAALGTMRLTPWVAATFLLVFLLFRDGLSRRQASGDLVIDAVAARVVTSYWLVELPRKARLIGR